GQKKAESLPKVVESLDKN
ncbi:hypothetical protein CP8484711_0939B, partial [Chlamydia psittaci 84-8471/1]